MQTILLDGQYFLVLTNEEVELKQTSSYWRS